MSASIGLSAASEKGREFPAFSTGRGNAFCLRHVGDARHVGDGGYSRCLFGYVTMWVGASQSDARQPIRTSLSETKEAVYRPMRGAQLGWGTDYGRNIGQQWQKCKSKYQVLANLTALQIYFEGQLESAPDKPWSYAFNTLAPERCGSNSKSVIFHFLLEFEFLSTSCLNPHWWEVNVILGSGLVPSGNKPWPGPMLTRSMLPYMASLGNDGSTPMWTGPQIIITMEMISLVCKLKYMLSLSPGLYQYRQVSNISLTKSQHLKDSHTVLRLSLPNPLKPDVKSKMKM